MWEASKVCSMSRTNLIDLINNKIPAIRVRSFADDREITSLSELLVRCTIQSNSIPEVTRYGLSQYHDGIKATKENYFNKASLASSEFNSIFEKSFNPMHRFLSLLRSLRFDADIMHEEGFGQYFAGTAKERNGESPVHVDFAPQDSAGWKVAKSLSQLAWNLYLKVPKQDPGELRIWNKQWRREDDIFMVRDSYYFDSHITAGSSSVTIGVDRGDIILINSRNYHSVLQTSQRLSYGSFISFMGMNKLRMWS